MAGACLAGACLLAAPVSNANPPTGVMQQLTLPGTELRYTLSLPGGEPPAAPAPLIIALHYGGPVSPWYGRGLLEGVVEPALRALGAVMVAPDCPEQRWTDGRCPHAVRAVMDAVRAQFAIDPARVLITGYSKGGMGTWALAAVEPEAYSAAIVMAGRPPEPLDADTWRLPLHVIHARDDELLALAPVEVAVARLRAAGAPVTLDVLDGVTHFETGRFIAPLRAAVPWLNSVWAR